jgi:parvulin-like peptidyl-prolyl isomerase
MLRTIQCVALCLLGIGCRGAPAPVPAATPAASAERTPEAACLAEASSPRTPRKEAPDKIGVSHVLVRHKELARAEGATRTRGEACLRAKAAREKLLAGADWSDVSRDYSDAGDATQGKLGSVAKSELDETFANAAFSLDVGELSHVVESPRGFHVIARTE